MPTRFTSSPHVSPVKEWGAKADYVSLLATSFDGVRKVDVPFSHSKQEWVRMGKSVPTGISLGSVKPIVVSPAKRERDEELKEYSRKWKPSIPKEELKIEASKEPEKIEPILSPSVERFFIDDIKYKRIWDLFEKHVDSFWTWKEIDLGHDMKDFKELSTDEKHFIKHVLAFFAGADGIVNENLAERFMREVQIPEARAFYTFQAAMESIHSVTYAKLLQTYVPDKDERDKLFRAIELMPSIKAKADWALRWIKSSKSFAERLVAFALVEWVFFSGSFCAIFWMKKRGKMPGLTFSNELISRDEGLHCMHAVELYHTLIYGRLSQERIEEIVKDAVKAEKEFVCGALPVHLIGMNSDLMSQHIEFMADGLVEALGYKKIWNSKEPFEWMETISLQGKTNFFEKRVGDYQKSQSATGRAKSSEEMGKMKAEMEKAFEGDGSIDF